MILVIFTLQVDVTLIRYKPFNSFDAPITHKLPTNAISSSLGSLIDTSFCVVTIIFESNSSKDLFIVDIEKILPTSILIDVFGNKTD